MENSDYLGLSGAQLHILVTIHRAGSLSLAARMLDMNQSTVSYWLGQMRERLGDPLFVRVGQGMQPTERMERVLVPATEVLQQLQMIAEPTGYDPAEDTGALRIACSAIERDLLAGPVIQAATEEAPNLRFELLPLGSGFQMTERLREGQLDLVIYPAVLEPSDDIYQRVLHSVTDVVYFDPDHPLAQDDLDAYGSRPHARIALGPDAEFTLDRRFSKAGMTRRVGLQVHDFDVLAQMILGTPLIATLPSHMQHCSFCKLDWVSAPWQSAPLDVAMYWHARHHGSDRHRYWRKKITTHAKVSELG